MTDYYVDPVSGSDGNAGTSFGAAWATTQHAADNATAGDNVFLCKTGTETISAKIDMDTNAGDTTSGLINFISYNSLGTAYEAGYEIQVSSSITHLLDYTSTCARVKWIGVDFNGNSNVSSHLLNHSAASEGNGTVYMCCTIRNGNSNGAEMRATYVQFIDCDIYGHGGDGLRSNNVASSRWTGGQVIRCKIHDNTGDGIGNLGANLFSIIGNLIYDNGGAGIETGAASGGGTLLTIESNTIHGNTSHGIELENWVSTNGLSANNSIVINNTCSGNGGYGFYFGTASPVAVDVMDYNHTYNNTSGATDRTGGMPGQNNQTGDPEFESVTDGSEDFRIASTSPLFENGPLSSTIGALAAVAGGGGGGGIRLAGPGGLVG